MRGMFLLISHRVLMQGFVVPCAPEARMISSGVEAERRPGGDGFESSFRAADFPGGSNSGELGGDELGGDELGGDVKSCPSCH